MTRQPEAHMTPNHATIANHLRATSFTDADKRLLHLCFQALGPEGAAPSDADTPIGPQSLVVEPAGWVVRGTHANGKQAHTISADGAFETHGKPYVFRLKDLADSDARVWVKSCPKWTVEVLPVDAAGNILPAPEPAGIAVEGGGGEVALTDCTATGTQSVEPAGWVVEDTDKFCPAAARWRGANGCGATPAEVTPLASQPFCGLGSRFVAHPYAEVLRLDAAEQAPTPTVEPLIAMHGDDQCIATRGWRCSLQSGHNGPHKHCGDDGTAHAIWAADSEPPPAPSGPWVVAVTMRGERRWDTGIASPRADLAAAKRWDVRADADARANEWRYWSPSSSSSVLPLAEAERLAGAAPTPAPTPTPKPSREVVGYRVRQVMPAGRTPWWVEPDPHLVWCRTPRKPAPMTLAEANTLLKAAREWAKTPTVRADNIRFRRVRVTRPARPDVSAAIAACDLARSRALLHAGWVESGGTGTVGLRDTIAAIDTALAALRGQR